MQASPLNSRYPPVANRLVPPSTWSATHLHAYPPTYLPAPPIHPNAWSGIVRCGAGWGGELWGCWLGATMAEIRCYCCCFLCLSWSVSMGAVGWGAFCLLCCVVLLHCAVRLCAALCGAVCAVVCSAIIGFSWRLLFKWFYCWSFFWKYEDMFFFLFANRTRNDLKVLHYILIHFCLVHFREVSLQFNTSTPRDCG